MKQSPTTKAALPDKLKLDGRFIQNGDIGWDGADTAEVLDKGERGEAFAAELVLRYNAHEQMRGGLQKAIALLESSAHAQHHIQCPAHECEPLGGKDCVCVDEIQPLRNALAQLERPA